MKKGTSEIHFSKLNQDKLWKKGVTLNDSTGDLNLMRLNGLSMSWKV
jgi:hypothetical protein